MVARISAFIGMMILFIGFPQFDNLLADTEFASWGSIKAQASEELSPAGKLVVSQNKAGGWRGRGHQPHAPRTPRFIAPWSGTYLTHEVPIYNPTSSAVAGADVKLTFDPNVVVVYEVSRPPSGFILQYNNQVPGEVKVVMASVTGTNESEFVLFWVQAEILANTVESTKLKAEFVFYDELGRKIGTQTVSWIFDMKSLSDIFGR